jgi:hypothetical protein
VNYAKIAERYGVTIEEAAKLRAHIDSKNFLDWSEASYAEIDEAMHHAGCAVLGKALTNPEGRANRNEGMKQFRAKLLTTHQKLLAGGDANVKRKDATGQAAREYHTSAVASLKSAQEKFGEV